MAYVRMPFPMEILGIIRNKKGDKNPSSASVKASATLPRTHARVCTFLARARTLYVRLALISSRKDTKSSPNLIEQK